MGEVDADLLLRMLFVPFTALMDDNFGYKGVQAFGRQFCNTGVLFGERYEFIHIACRLGQLPDFFLQRRQAKIKRLSSHV